MPCVDYFKTTKIPLLLNDTEKTICVVFIATVVALFGNFVPVSRATKEDPVATLKF